MQDFSLRHTERTAIQQQKVLPFEKQGEEEEAKPGTIEMRVVNKGVFNM